MNFYLIEALTVVAFALILAIGERLLGTPLYRLRSVIYRRRLQSRLSRGEDRYFEELRALESYQPVAPPARPFHRAFLFYFGIMAAVTLIRILSRLLMETL